MNKQLTTKEAAENLGISDARIRQMIIKGTLKAQKFGHIHLIQEADLEAVRERKPGRPKKDKEAIKK